MSGTDNLQARVPGEHAQRVRSTVAGMQRILGPHYTLRQFIVDATAEHCRRLEEEHHDGQPWPPVAAGLPAGARLRAAGDSSRITPEEGR